jgi:hypothetical protein
MRRFQWGLLAGLALLPLAAGCSWPLAKAPVVPPVGLVYEHIKAPLSVNYKDTQVNPGKVGSVKTRYFCGWPLIFNSSFAMDDASIEAAARQGGLDEVAYADYEMMNVLGVYSEFTVHAYGK